MNVNNGYMYKDCINLHVGWRIIERKQVHGRPETNSEIATELLQWPAQLQKPCKTMKYACFNDVERSGPIRILSK